MTTNYAVAARGYARSAAIAGALAFLSLGLAGCETASNLLGTSGDSTPSAEVATPAPVAPATSTKIAVAPVIGAPENVAKQMQAGLSSALAQQKVSVAQNATDKSDFTLRGYVVSAREKSGVKVSYIWDITDPAGQRVNRITGEEMVSAGADRDPWAAVSQQVISSISSKTASQVAAWLPKQSPQASAAPVASAPAAAKATRTAAAAPAATGATAPAATSAAAAPAETAATGAASANQATGSIGKGPATAIVPNVTGAPGDGRVSLTTALQRELTKNGVSLTSSPAANTYRVEGVVAVGEAKDGKQPIKIDWHVKDPGGKSIGTVSQKNEIAAGSLDGSWGATADAAAAAAAQGIVKLIPKVN